MLLVPLQPLSGESVVEPSVSSGALPSGNGFQGVLQEAQHHLATASSDPPEKSAPPSLASVVSEALTEALTPDEGVAHEPQSPQISQGKNPGPVLTTLADVVAGEQLTNVTTKEGSSVIADDHPILEPLPDVEGDAEMLPSNGSVHEMERDQIVADRTTTTFSQVSSGSKASIEQPRQVSQEEQLLPKVNAEFMPKPQQETATALVQPDSSGSQVPPNPESPQQPLATPRPQEQVVEQDMPVVRPMSQSSNPQPVVQEQGFGESNVVNQVNAHREPVMGTTEAPVVDAQDSNVVPQRPFVPVTGLSDAEALSSGPDRPVYGVDGGAETSDMQVENREATPATGDTPTPVVSRSEFAGASGVVRDQTPVTERPVSDVPVSGINREALGSTGRSVEASSVLNREAMPVEGEAPVVSRSEFVGASGVVRDQAPVTERPVEQSRSQLSNNAPQHEVEQPVTPFQASVRKPEGAQSSLLENVPVVNDGRAPASQAPVGLVSGLRESTIVERQVISTTQQAVVSSTSASEDQAFTTGDENTAQRPLVSRQPVERAGGQASFVMPEAEVVQMPEQPVQTPEMQTADLDVEIGSVDRAASRIDTTVGSARSAQDGSPRVDLEATAEQIDRTHRVSEQIIRSARVLNRDGATQVTMRLDPPELGEVSIRLASTQNGIVSGEIAVESQKVQEIVQRNMGALREALSEQGIQIDQIDVSVDERGGSNLADREAFREALEDRADNSRSDADQQHSQEQQEMPEEESQAPPSIDGGVNFVA